MKILYVGDSLCFKKIVLLNARGGVYSEGIVAEVEIAVKYVASAF